MIPYFNKEIEKIKNYIIVNEGKYNFLILIVQRYNRTTKDIKDIKTFY